MDPKTKKILWKIFKILWIVLGCFLALFFVISLIHAQHLSASGFSAIGAGIAAGVLIALTMGMLVVYIVATLLFILIRWIIRKRKEKKE